MANIFKYATSELSQDAFLCWLFASIGEDGGFSDKPNQTGEIAKKVLLRFLGITGDDHNVEIHEIYRQWRKIDIIVECFVDGKPYCLVIEDKTKSSVHGGKGSKKSQLDIYSADIRYWEWKRNKKKAAGEADGFTVDDENIKCVLYKTSFLDDADHEHESEWQEYGVEDILKVFEDAGAKKGGIESEILASYIERLDYLKECFKADADVKSWVVSKDSLNDVAWERFFEKRVFEILNKEKKKYECSGWYYNGIYYGAKISLEGREKSLPSIHFHPRDFDLEEHPITIRFLIEGSDMRTDNGPSENLKNAGKWQEKLKASGFDIKWTEKIKRYLENPDSGRKKANLICRFDKRFVVEDSEASQLAEKVAETIEQVFEVLEK